MKSELLNKPVRQCFTVALVGTHNKALTLPLTVPLRTHQQAAYLACQRSLHGEPFEQVLELELLLSDEGE